MKNNFSKTIPVKLVRVIMGKNFFDVEEWKTFYGAKFSQNQLNQVTQFPWGEDILNSDCMLCGNVVKDCHFAFVGIDRINAIPLNILKWQKLHHDRFNSHGQSCWYYYEDFAKETMDFRWYLLHKEASKNKLYGVINDYYESPSVITEVTKNFLIFAKTNVLVNSSQSARCNNDIFVSFGRYIIDPGKLKVDINTFSGREGGISASRKKG